MVSDSEVRQITSQLDPTARHKYKNPDSLPSPSSHLSPTSYPHIVQLLHHLARMAIIDSVDTTLSKQLLFDSVLEQAGSLGHALSQDKEILFTPDADVTVSQFDMPALVEPEVDDLRRRKVRKVARRAYVLANRVDDLLAVRLESFYHYFSSVEYRKVLLNFTCARINFFV